MNLSYRKIHEKSPRQIPKVRPPVKPPAAFRAIKGNIDRRMVASECAQVIFQKKHKVISKTHEIPTLVF